MMNPQGLTRREMLRRGSAALASMTLVPSSWLDQALPPPPGVDVLPWLDQPPPNPAPEAVSNLLHWEGFSWETPNAAFFSVSHYDRPVIDEKDWTLEISGRVKFPHLLTLEQLKDRPRKEVVYTLECAGNHGFPWFVGGIGTARWAGTPLAPLLEAVGVLDDGIEVVFFGADKGEEEVRNLKTQQHFARSLSLQDALHPDVLLCYEMNGAPLPQPNGFPLRLIVPGWYGVANVKWLKRIEVRDTRYMGRFMARDYVTIREEIHSGEQVWTETSVGKTRIKSAPARVTRDGSTYHIVGAAWGAPIERVEINIDGSIWIPAQIDEGQDAPYAWKRWSMEWKSPSPGEHTITSRAIDTEGTVQPAMNDSSIANKHTYWESNGQITRRILIP